MSRRGRCGLRKRRGLVSPRKANGREDETPEDLELDRWIEPFPDALVPDRKYADVEAVTLAVSLPWSARYELEETYSPSSVVVNAIRTRITNFF